MIQNQAFKQVEESFLARHPDALKVIVVGGGAAGTLSSMHLAKSSEVPTLIYLVNFNYPNKLGVAYSTKCVKHLLNVPCGKMSVFEDKSDHLFNWLMKRSDLKEWGIENLTKKTFIPRTLFGEYMKDNFEKSLKNNPLIAICEINAEALKLKKLDIDSELKWAIDTTDGEVRGQAILFALGNFPPAIINGVQESAVAHEKFFRDPWKSESLSSLNVDQSVLLLGTGLTMVDMVMKLRNEGFKGKIVGFSRRGLLPNPHNMNDELSHVKKVWPEPEVEKVSLNQIFSLFRNYLKQEEAEGGTYRAVIDSLRPYTARYWQAFSDRDKSRFMRHLRALWDVHRHRMAASIHDFIETEKASGNLELVFGSLNKLSVEDQKFELNYRPRYETSAKTHPLKFSAVINCTGPSGDLLKVESSLCHSIFEQKAATRGPLNTGWLVDQDFRMVPTNKSLSPSRLYSIGSCLKGQLWESLAIPELKVQSKHVAKTILKDLN